MSFLKQFNKLTTILGLSAIIFGGIGLGFSSVKAEAFNTSSSNSTLKNPNDIYGRYGFIYEAVNFNCVNSSNRDYRCQIQHRASGTTVPVYENQITGLIVDVKHDGGSVNSWINADIFKKSWNNDKPDGFTGRNSQLNVGRYGYQRNFIDLESGYMNGTYGFVFDIKADYNNPSGTMWRNSAVKGTVWVEYRK